MMLNKLLALAATGFLLPIVATAQSAWKAQPLPVTTRWTTAVTPDNAWREYPRPQMKRDNWTNLNGLWNYAITDSGSTTSGPLTHQILVPFAIESALSGVQQALTPDKALWYQRRFNYRPLPGGHRLLLHFGAVDQQAEVYVNQKLVGANEGGYQAFTFDITDALTKGLNELLVKVLDPTDAGHAPKGKQTLMPSGMYYTATSGIWQTVWLEEVPGISINNLKITPDLEQDKVRITVNSNQQLTDDYTIKAKLQSANLTVTGTPAVTEIHLPNPHLWSPEDPFLYNLQVSLLYKGKTIDSVDTYFGMRKVEIKQDEKGVDRIFLNNKSYFNLGVLDQGFWPDGLYTAPSDEALAFDIQAIKAAGFNTIRKHIKVEPDRWYYHCDRLGMLVWQDMVNPPIPDEAAQKEFEKETAVNIDQLYNHPSITTWVVFNEGWGAYNQERVTQWVKNLDPSRLINGHTGENYYQQSPKDSLRKWPASDMTDIHAYPDPQMPPALPGKARVLGEFGGVGAMITGHQWNDLGGWGYITVGLDSLAKIYQFMNQHIKAMEKAGLSASIYTQPFDVESEQNGIFTYDRRISKLPQRLLKSALPKGLSPAPSEANIYQSVKKRFQANAADSLTLRRTAILAFRNGDTALAQQALTKYLRTVATPGTFVNLFLAGKLTSSINDPGFGYLVKYNKSLMEDYRLGDVLEKVKQLIFEKDLRPALELRRIYERSQWDSAKAAISHCYGPFVEEIIERNEVVILQAQKRWTDFSQIATLYLKKFAGNISPEALNAFAYDVFLHVSDTTAISNALEWAEMALSRKPDPEIYDTYASLLYKIGRKEEALKWQSIAVQMAPQEKVFEENYQKMKNGTLAWD